MESGRNSRIKTHHELLHSRDFQCCCCFHVRSGTIALGLLHVMMQMAMVAVVATALLNPGMFVNSEDVHGVMLQSSVDYDHEGPVLDTHRVPPSVFSTTSNTGFGERLTSLVRNSRQDFHYLLLLSTFSGFVSLLMMYGAIWGQPSYLMPFFAIMWFDFAHAVLHFIGSFAERHSLPYRGPAAASTTADPFHGFYLFTAVIVRAYLLNMVWSCYKFLRLRQELLRRSSVVASVVGGAGIPTSNDSVSVRTVHTRSQRRHGGRAGGVDDTSSSRSASQHQQSTICSGVLDGDNNSNGVLPDYESTQKCPYDFYPSPPPPYATATQMPTVEQAAAVMPPPSYHDVAAGLAVDAVPLSGSQVTGAVRDTLPAAPSSLTVILPPPLPATTGALGAVRAVQPPNSSCAANDLNGFPISVPVPASASPSNLPVTTSFSATIANNVTVKKNSGGRLANALTEEESQQNVVCEAQHDSFVLIPSTEVTEASSINCDRYSCEATSDPFAAATVIPSTVDLNITGDNLGGFHSSANSVNVEKVPDISGNCGSASAATAGIMLDSSSPATNAYNLEFTSGEPGAAGAAIVPPATTSKSNNNL